MGRIRLGDMLVQARIVETTHVDEALAVQKAEGGRLGAILVELGYVSEVQLAQVLSNQLSIPWVNLYHVDFSRELLNLVPAEVAEQTACIPVYVRRVRSQGETMFVATDDPLNDAALATISQHAAMPVKPMVASSSDVRNAIRVYYFGGKPSAATAPPRVRKAQSIPAPAPTRTSIPPVVLDPAELEEAAVVIPAAAPVPAAAPDPAPVPLRKKKRKPGKMITLTLLDGTTVKLPAPGSKPAQEEEPDEGLTTRDLIAALLARSEGKDVSSILPDGQWEPLVATLLSLLLKKGLIADWEFVEEWRKHRR